MKKLLLIVLGLTFFSLFLFPVLNVQADCNPTLLLPPCTCSGNCKLNDFLALAARMAQYGLGLLTLVTIGFVIQGGFSLMTAMGSSEKIESGKKLLGGTFRGMAIVLLAWIMVNTIIFLFTGNACGLLFGGTGNPWWKFEETPISNTCDPHVANNCAYLQACTDTTGWDEQAKVGSHCWSYGTCEGGDEKICCDTGETIPQNCQAPAAGACGDLAALAQQYNALYPAADAPDLTALRNCVESNVPAAMIDQNQIYTYERDNTSCNYTHGQAVCGDCAHSQYSCHYGGVSGNQGAQGVDYNAASGYTEEQLKDTIFNVLDNQCAGLWGGRLFETDHTHVSSVGCNSNS